jgi:hypothetical protein
MIDLRFAMQWSANQKRPGVHRRLGKKAIHPEIISGIHCNLGMQRQVNSGLASKKLSRGCGRCALQEPIGVPVSR